MFIILLLGDIESNPGPTTTDDISKAISVVHLNARSIRNKLEFLFEEFSDHDILYFTETHLDDNVSTNYLLSQSSIFYPL